MSRTIYAAVNSTCGHVGALGNESEPITRFVLGVGGAWFLSVGVSDAELESFLNDEKCARCTPKPTESQL